MLEFGSSIILQDPQLSFVNFELKLETGTFWFFFSISFFNAYGECKDIKPLGEKILSVKLQ